MIRRAGLQVVAALCVSAVVVSAQTPALMTVTEAARRADREAVRSLLKSGSDVNASQGDGMTALHWAAERGDLAIAEMLIFAGANVSAVTRLGGYTPLHLAARTGSAPVVGALLKAGTAPAAPAASGVTALHLAAAAGSADAVTMLLDKGVDVNIRESESNQTPLIFAASAGELATVKALIARGGDVKLASRVIDLSKQQQLDRAASTARSRVLDAAVPRGQEPTPSQQQAAIQAGREIVISGKIPEPEAAAAGRGAGAAGAAAGGGRGGGGGGGGGRAGGNAGGGAGGAQQQTATDLQNADGPPPAISAKGGMTALHHAARQGHVKVALALLDAGADVNQKMADGNSPLLVSLINGQFDLAMSLIERGANPNQASDSLAVTPLWAAVNTAWQPRTRFPQPQEMDLQKATYLDVMKALLDKGADPDARVRAHPWFMVYTGCGNGNCGLTNTTGSTAFWRAAYGTDVAAMKLLVKYGADPNIPTMTGAGRGGGGGGGGGGGRGGAAGGRGGAAGGRGGGGGAGAGAPGGAPGTGGATPDLPATATPPAAPAGPTLDPSGLPPVPAGGPGVYALHAAAGVEYGEGYAGNAHRHAPDSWLAAVKYLVEELGADVNARDDGGYTPLHHAAARGDNEMILYLVSKGADVKAVSRRNQTTADMANGPVSRISPFPDTIALLVKLGAKNNNRCQSCAP